MFATYAPFFIQMKHYFLSIILSILASQPLWGQSLELMVGHERIFADIQWLKFVDVDKHISVFSRTRATVDYENQTDLFSGAYVNYTLKNGLGASLVGKAGRTGGGADLGIHIFKAHENWMLFGLASVGLKKELTYSWFSILRFTPKLNENWRFYSSLELFHLFAQGTHLISVQRIRLGVEYEQFQWGLAGNLTEVGEEWSRNVNAGVFVRKVF